MPLTLVLIHNAECFTAQLCMYMYIRHCHLK